MLIEPFHAERATRTSTVLGFTVEGVNQLAAPVADLEHAPTIGAARALDLLHGAAYVERNPATALAANVNAPTVHHPVSPHSHADHATTSPTSMLQHHEQVTRYDGHPPRRITHERGRSDTVSDVTSNVAR